MATDAKDQNVEVQLTKQQVDEQKVVNDYLKKIGCDAIPANAVVMMDGKFIDKVSCWDIMVKKVKTDSVDPGIEVVFDKDSVEVTQYKDVTTRLSESEEGASTRSTYTIFQNSYEPVYSH